MDDQTIMGKKEKMGLPFSAWIQSTLSAPKHIPWCRLRPDCQAGRMGLQSQRWVPTAAAEWAGTLHVPCLLVKPQLAICEISWGKGGALNI